MKLDQILKSEKKLVANALGIKMSDLKTLKGQFHYKLKGKLKAEVLRNNLYSHLMYISEKEFGEQIKELTKAFEKLENYNFSFCHCDQSGKCYLNIVRICPCCG